MKVSRLANQGGEAPAIHARLVASLPSASSAVWRKLVSAGSCHTMATTSLRPPAEARPASQVWGMGMRFEVTTRRV